MLRALVCTEPFFIGHTADDFDINKKLSYIVKRKGYRKNYIESNEER